MITLGKHSYAGANDIECSDIVDLQIGKYCSIASELTIATGLHPTIEHREAVTNYPLYEQKLYEYWLCKNDGKVVIENDVWVAQKVIILDGVTVHDGAIIGAGAVVTKDVPPYAFVAGNPAVVKWYRFSEDIIKKLLYIKWWDWTDERVKDTAPYMKDINTFIKIYG